MPFVEATVTVVALCVDVRLICHNGHMQYFVIVITYANNHISIPISLGPQSFVF